MQELLQSKIGTTAYAQVHNQIRQRAAEKRNARKRDLALQAINDPVEEAKRKAKRQELKKAQKKRKCVASLRLLTVPQHLLITLFQQGGGIR